MNKVWGMCHISVSTLVMLFLLLPVTVFADNSNDMVLHGTLIEPPDCSINGGNMISVNFGQHVGISKVDGVNYKQPVPYLIQCEADATGNTYTLGLTVNGIVTSFDNAAVQMVIDGAPGNNDLGVKLLLGGKDLILNKRMLVSAANQPVLEAVPVKKPGTTLPEGTFHGTATLLANYE